MEHYNLTSLTTMCGGDSRFMYDFIKLFIDTAPANIAQIKALREDNNWTEISEILHKIKPTVELFGMMHIHNEIKLAEQAGKTGQDSDRMDAWLDHILSNLERGMEVLKTELPNYS